MNREPVAQWPKGRSHNEEQSHFEEKGEMKAKKTMDETEGLKDSLKESVDEVSKNISSAFQKLGDQIKEYSEVGRDKITHSVENNPLKAVGIAAAVGFILAYFLCGRGD